MGQEDDSVDGVNCGSARLLSLNAHTQKLIGVVVSAVFLCVSLQLLHFFATFFLYLLGHVRRE